MLYTVFRREGISLVAISGILSRKSEEKITKKCQILMPLLLAEIEICLKEYISINIYISESSFCLGFCRGLSTFFFFSISFLYFFFHKKHNDD